MQQDRRHQKRRSDRKTQRDSARGNARRVVVPTLLEASRSALGRLAQVTRLGHASHDGTRVANLSPTLQQVSAPSLAKSTRPRRSPGGRGRMRGAALMEIVLTVAALATGAQGFAHWQSVDGVSLKRPLIANDVPTDVTPDVFLDGRLS
jgi:hypothetical protein